MLCCMRVHGQDVIFDQVRPASTKIGAQDGVACRQGVTGPECHRLKVSISASWNATAWKSACSNQPAHAAWIQSKSLLPPGGHAICLACAHVGVCMRCSCMQALWLARGGEGHDAHGHAVQQRQHAGGGCTGLHAGAVQQYSLRTSLHVGASTLHVDGMWSMRVRHTYVRCHGMCSAGHCYRSNPVAWLVGSCFPFCNCTAFTALLICSSGPCSCLSP